jgi:hypothetical protein
MTSSVIGALRVTLGLDSAAFNRGVSQTQRQAAALRNSLMSISAGMAIVGGASFAMVRSTAKAGQDISNQAALAGATADEFQRWAAAAQSVGISQEKMADILKDMRDRVGDFLATGAGPIADFFENIAPQVGITADQFRNLSGPDALQLYYSSLEKANLSQSEMTFYMEAMASNSTALIPLLANSGAELIRLGESAAEAGALMSEKGIANSLEFQAALAKLSQGTVGLRNSISENLMPMFTSMIEFISDKIIPAFHSVVETVGGWVEAFQGLPGPVQEAAGIVAVALGAGGPIVLAVGVLSTVISGLVAASGPIGLFIAAASLLAAAWATWGDEIKAIVGPAAEWIAGKFNAIVDSLQRVVEVAGLAKEAIVDFFTFSDERTAMAAQRSEDAMRASGEAIGAAMTDGLVAGATDPAAIGDLQDYLSQFSDAARDEFEIQSPSRVFTEIGRYLSEGLAVGIGLGAGSAKDALSGLIDDVLAGVDIISAATDALSSYLSQMASSMMNTGLDTLFSAVTGAIFGSPVAIGANANGTNNWRGGLTSVNERGGEIMNLPQGTQIIPHDISKRMADSATGGASNINISINGVNDPAMVAEGVKRGLAAYDQQLPGRIRSITSDPYRGY